MSTPGLAGQAVTERPESHSRPKPGSYFGQALARVDTSTSSVRSLRFCNHWSRTDDPRDVRMCNQVAWLDVAGSACCVHHGEERLAKALAASMGEGPRP